jgi:hypothetical protein
VIGGLAVAAALTFPSVAAGAWVFAGLTILWDVAISVFGWPRWSIPPAYRL